MMRNTLVEYLYALGEAGVTHALHRDAKGVTRLQKPDKLYLENTNLMFALRGAEPEIGGLRETFFFNQVSHRHLVEYPDANDFIVNRKWLFEIGGKGKRAKDVKGDSAAYLVVDGMETGFGQRLPLWLFGFLY